MSFSRPYLLQKSRPSRKKRRLIIVFAALMLLVLAVVVSINIISAFNSFHNTEAWAQELRLQGSGNDVIYLVYGVDYWGASPYVERLVLVHHDTLSGDLSLVLIPGNTKVETEERGPEPMGQAYSRLGNPGFIELVRDFIGLPVHHYIELNYQSIVVLGDYLGGLETAVLAGAPGEGMLPAGRERLGGFELYRFFLTSRYREPPFDQVIRQQMTLAALWSKAENIRFWQWPRFLNLGSGYIETDLSWREVGFLHEQFRDRDFNEVNLLLLPGEEEVLDGCLYWVVEPDTLKDLVRKINEGYLVLPAEVKVEVLNGCGVDGLAASVAAMLEEEGFNVVRVADADRTDYEKTLVIALGELTDKARAVALFIPGASVLHQYNPDLKADVTVIIGHDYTGE